MSLDPEDRRVFLDTVQEVISSEVRYMLGEDELGTEREAVCRRAATAALDLLVDEGLIGEQD